MFANLIESQSHGKEFKRRGRFVIATAFAYTVLFFVAGIVSIYAYDARVDAQTSELELLNWVPPVTAVTADPARPTRPIRRTVPSSAPVDPNLRVAIRTVAVASTSDPTKVPDHPGTQGIDVPPVTGPVVLGNRNVDPRGAAPANSDGCITCNGPAPVVRVEETPPTPTPVKPQPQRLPSTVLVSKAISLPQPAYPPIAKQIHIAGAVAVQILVDEQGKVISAQVVSGHPTLTGAARDAAMRARFTPTLLSGQPVKVQGTIIYNFVLQ
jgi:protein TonB